MAVPVVVVYRVEGYATGLYEPRPGAHDVPSDIKSASLEKFSRHGLSSVRFGRMLSSPVIREC